MSERAKIAIDVQPGAVPSRCAFSIGRRFTVRWRSFVSKEVVRITLVFLASEAALPQEYPENNLPLSDLLFGWFSTLVKIPHLCSIFSNCSRTGRILRQRGGFPSDPCWW